MHDDKKGPKLTVNYEDYSSGRVIYSSSGATNFPIRLSNQIFELCVNYLQSKGHNGPYKIYDPFCGFAYTLTVTGFIYPTLVKSLYGSDIDEKSLEFANKNLGLLSDTGIDKRIAELENLINKYDKDSHKEALVSVRLLKRQIAASETEVLSFKHNAIASGDLPHQVNAIDIVMADLPYGQLTEWRNTTRQNNGQIFLNHLKGILGSTSIVAITSDKKQIVEHEGYKRIKKFNTGKRRTLLLENIR